MEITKENYYSDEANAEYMSVSQYKTFAGSIGRHGCEARALAKLAKEWESKPTDAMLIGSYVDAYYEGSLNEFKGMHPEIFKRDGDLKAEFKKAEVVIARTQKDEMFKGFMSGEKQRIFVGELFGCKWKVKLDSYIPHKAIVDLKVVKQVHEDGLSNIGNVPKREWVRDYGMVDWMIYWGYDIQGAVYQEIVRQNTGETLPFFIAAADKQDEPDIDIFHLDNQCLRDALSIVEANMPRILDLKAGLIEPDRCESCDYCRHTKVLKSVTDIHAWMGKEKKDEK